MFDTRSLALALAALCSAAAADAKPRGVTVLEFDGQRKLADAGRTAVLAALADRYTLVAAEAWQKAKANEKPGKNAWPRAAKKTGVDAVIEGWVQDEGRSKVLTVIVTDASNGSQLDQLVVKLGNAGAISDDNQKKLKDGIEERFDWIEPTTSSSAPEYPVVDKVPVTGTGTGTTAPARDKQAEETNQVYSVFRPPIDEEITVDPKRSHVVIPTSRFSVRGGFGYGSHTLHIDANNPMGVQQYESVPHASFGLESQFYPWPRKQYDGIPSGVGFGFGIEHSLGSTVVVDNPELDEVSEHNTTAYSWHADIHYRSALSDVFALDGQLGYGQSHYSVEDPPEQLEVPVTDYQYITAGATVDLKMTERSSVGFSGKYLHVLSAGALNDVMAYGPGSSWGLQVDGHFTIPLPAGLHLRGDIVYQRIKTSFDGAGDITDEEGVDAAVDTTITGSVKVGFDF
jgi:hypothetical protein